MFKIIVFTHGNLAPALIQTAEMATGAVELIESYQVLPGSDLDQVQKEVMQSIADANNQNLQVLILTDLFFGTPFNLLVQSLNQGDFYHVTGVNLPMLVEAMSMQRDNNCDLETSLDTLIERSREAIKNCNYLDLVK